MPYETVYGLSVRKISWRPEIWNFCENVGIFGRPIEDGRIEVSCINRVMLHKVHYDIHFGPAREKYVYADDQPEEPDQEA